MDIRDTLKKKQNIRHFKTSKQILSFHLEKCLSKVLDFFKASHAE